MPGMVWRPCRGGSQLSHSASAMWQRRGGDARMVAQPNEQAAAVVVGHAVGRYVAGPLGKSRLSELWTPDTRRNSSKQEKRDTPYHAPADVASSRETGKRCRPLAWLRTSGVETYTTATQRQILKLWTMASAGGKSLVAAGWRLWICAPISSRRARSGPHFKKYPARRHLRTAFGSIPGG